MTPEEFAQMNAAKAGGFPMNPQMQKQMQMGGALRQQPQQQGGMNQAMMEQIARLPPDEQEAAIRRYTQDFKGRGAAADEMMSKAQGVMDEATPQGLGGGKGGGYYTAANPLEHLVSAVKKNKARGSYDEGVAAKKLLSDNYGDSSYDYMNAGVQKYLNN